MKRGKVTALVMAFIMAVSVLASPVTMLNTNAAVKAKKITMAKKATLEVGAKKKLKVTVKLVCIPSSRQLKKYKIFVLPGVYRATFLCRQSLLFMKFHWC